MKQKKPRMLCCGHNCDRRKDCLRHEIFDKSADSDITAHGRLCGLEYRMLMPIPAEQVPG